MRCTASQKPNYWGDAVKTLEMKPSHPPLNCTPWFCTATKEEN